MRKRRNAKNNPNYAGESDAHGSNSYGAGASQNSSKFAVFDFDFADDDLRVETESRKFVSKYPIKSPSKKSAHDQHVDKYVFLECFAKGAATSQNDPGNRTSDRTFGADATPPGGSPTVSLTDSLSSHNFGCLSCGTKSNIQGNGRHGGYRTGRNHNKILYIDSDEDRRMPLRTSTRSHIAVNKGLSEGQSSRHGTCATDCEAVVVFAPKYVKYGKMYYTNCVLSFTRGYIRLEGSPLCERNRSNSLEWSTFDIIKIEYQPCESVKADVVNLHLKVLDTNEAETCNSTSGLCPVIPHECIGFMELEFVVLDDPQWLTKQEEIKSLDPKYKNAWLTILSDYSFDESFDDITYPEGDPDAVFISRKDVELLQPRTFLNDTIIDFYIKYVSPSQKMAYLTKYLLNKMKPEEQRRLHFFNTFFFRKLADMDRILSRTWKGREAFERVRKWTKNVDLFEKDYIFIPVNFSLHWSLIVICYPGEVTNLRDKDTDDSSRRPCILHMDSIRGSHRGLEKIIRNYLWEEWKERHGKQESDISKKFLNLCFNALQLPQQENFSDCGLFLLHYAELFLAQAANFSTRNYSNFLNKDWFLPDEVSVKKREHIRKLIHRIVEDTVLRNPPAEKYRSSDLDEGDSGVKIVEVRESDENEICDGAKFSSVNHDIKEKQSFLDILNPVNTTKSVTDDTFQQCEQLMSSNHFSNARLPMERETFEKQNTCTPGDTSRSCEAWEDSEPMPVESPLSFQVGEIEIPFPTSKTCASTPQMTSNVHDEEDFVPEVTPTSEMEKDEYDRTSMLSEDLADCVVEDSEEETGTEIIRRTRRPYFTPGEVITIV